MKCKQCGGTGRITSAGLTSTECLVCNGVGSFDGLQTFWLVWRESGGQVPCHQHATEQEAVAEAERLAHLHIGCNFVVLKSMKRVRVIPSDPITEDYVDERGNFPSSTKCYHGEDMVGDPEGDGKYESPIPCLGRHIHSIDGDDYDCDYPHAGHCCEDCVVNGGRRDPRVPPDEEEK